MSHFSDCREGISENYFKQLKIASDCGWGRVAEFTINRELHKLMIDGIKYEKLTVGETEWIMRIFEDDELKDYFEQCIPVKNARHL